jgi:tripartite-type tricarboxylate transporter receptor subunit TctC
MSYLRSVSTAALAVACGCALLAGSVSAAEVTFRGKTIDVLIGSDAGGGTDGTTRLVGQFLEKYLPGNPKMRYRNIPGGHGAKALNYFVDPKVKPDGTTWIGGSSSHIDPNSLRKEAVEYNPTKFEYIGGVSRGGSIIFARKDKIANLTDKSKPPVVVGVLDGNRSWEQMITWGAEVLDWNVRFVVGYPGTSFLLLAIRRGETNMVGTSNLSLLQEMFATGDYVGVAQLGDSGADNNGVIEGRTNFDKIPPFPNLVQGKMKGIQAETFEFWTKLNDLDKWYALPPNTPKEVVEAYRVAWSKAIKDPEFTKKGQLQFSADFAPVSGEIMKDAVDKTAYPKKEILAYMEEMQVKHGLPAQPLSDEELAALAKETGLDKGADKPLTLAVLLDVGNGGRDAQFKVGDATHKVDVSSSRTKVTIDGVGAERAALKTGLTCLIDYPGDGKQADAFDCASKPEGVAALKAKQEASSKKGVEAVLAAVGSGGRDVTFPFEGGSHKVDISSSRTSVTIGGKKMERADLKPGLKCVINYPGDGKEADSIACN